ncbi:MAG TPA: D-hexose-6-phosphate mutarotase [Burkholderiaceae bacterium]|nr:D-hexose-6-phosphate mutarotase [Burkholderiaceae bacterium]
MLTTSSWQGLETLLIDTAYARCEIALFGAQVLSFVPRDDGRDLLWCSDAKLAPGRPVRGGVPVCWPWFAKQDRPPDAVQHGFVRRMTWRLATCAERLDGRVRVVLTLAAPPEGWPDGQDWPAGCAPELELVVGAELEMSLRTVNATEAPVVLTQALHTYFRVGDVRRIGIEGLQGLRYLDKLRDFDEFGQFAPWRFEGACDRIYLESGPTHRIDDPVLGRSIVVESLGSASTVVWNPGAEGIAALGDVPLADWYRYVCVEAGNCAPLDRVTLPPGGETTLVQRISARPLAA